MILDGERAAELMTATVGNPRDYLLAFYPQFADRLPPLDHVVLTARPMTGRINHGVWIASCECGMQPNLEKGAPAPGCVVWLSIPLGFCLRCGNQGTGRGWRPIIVPPAEERQRLEAVLACRPNVTDQNWSPGETFESLWAENVEHGDPIPAEAA